MTHRISHAPFNRQLRYLVGLIVTCFFYFSCESWSQLDMHQPDVGKDFQNECSPSVDAGSCNVYPLIKGISMYGRGKYELSFEKKDDCVHQYGQDAVGYYVQGEKASLYIADGVSKYDVVAGYLSHALSINRGSPIIIQIQSNPKNNSEGLIDYACNEVHKKWVKICQDREEEKYKRYFKQGFWTKEQFEQFEKDKEWETNGYAAAYRGAATTFCEIYIDGFNLKWRNIGDSGLMVVRDGKIVHQSEDTIKGCNLPCAISMSKDEYKIGSYSFGTFTLKPQDVLIMYTDGVYDNLKVKKVKKQEVKNQEVITIVKRHRSKKSPQERADHISKDIVVTALTNSTNENILTNWGDKNILPNWRDKKRNRPLGGKKDDMTVLVVVY